jgi:hypothetical protein
MAFNGSIFHAKNPHVIPSSRRSKIEFNFVICEIDATGFKATVEIF